LARFERRPASACHRPAAPRAAARPPLERRRPRAAAFPPVQEGLSRHPRAAAGGLSPAAGAARSRGARASSHDRPAVDGELQAATFDCREA
jgi:hypothetical protein